jgi:hypothetical protein
LVIWNTGIDELLHGVVTFSEFGAFVPVVIEAKLGDTFGLWHWWSFGIITTLFG